MQLLKDTDHFFLLFTPIVVAGVRFSAAFVCLSVCLLTRTISQKTASAGITKHDTEMLHRES